MTESVLNDVLLLKNTNIDKLTEYLHCINLLTFDDVIDKFGKEAFHIILYIVTAYSEDSPLLILRQDSKTEQEGICEYLNIPEFKRKDLMELKDNYVRQAVTEYVTRFAGEVFRSLMFMKIQLRDYQLAITNKRYYTTKEPKDGSGEIQEEKIEFLFDWKEQGKAQQQCNILAKQIELTEKQIREQVKRMDGIEELKTHVRSAKELGTMRADRKGNIEKFIK